MEDTKSIRYRANVSRTSKGYSVECSGDATGYSKKEVLEEIQSLLGDLERIYPREG